MQSLGSLAKACTKHPENLLTAFCLHPFCKDRVLCSDCQSSHDLSHRSQFKSILSILLTDMDAEFQCIKMQAEAFEHAYAKKD